MGMGGGHFLPFQIGVVRRNLNLEWGRRKRYTVLWKGKKLVWGCGCGLFLAGRQNSR